MIYLPESKELKSALVSVTIAIPAQYLDLISLILLFLIFFFFDDIEINLANYADVTNPCAYDLGEKSSQITSKKY